ncbi:hypothetical protein OC846_002353 [Tilletia horrida]|uniref:Small ribosomal subunit protein mS29 n=1 Tax=Tilletia horrida TaxID=155126 RepID=A0AAN6GRI4_9BASI|nr:hypothetical protein OC846_002353 [Tilletia horrida]KAK0567785.1 hypothetical protein OC861_002528 [Tilletia horrida]
MSAAPSLAAPFSTSSRLAATPKKATPAKKKTALKKKSGPSGPRGEGGKRRAGSGGDGGSASSRVSEWSMPKPDMSELAVLSADSATSQLGQVVAYSTSTLNALSHFGTPKQLGLALARQPRPRTLVRPQSLELFKHLDNSAETAAKQNAVLHGPDGAGASTLLIHAVSHALDKGWIVLYLPSLLSFINSTSAYTYDAAHRAYLQPIIAQQILTKLVVGNGNRLKHVRLDEEAVASASQAIDAAGQRSSGTGSTSALTTTLLAPGQNLHELAQAAVADSTPPSVRQIIFETVLRSLAAQTGTPFLVAMDDFQALYSQSQYRDPDYRQLHSYELAVPSTLLQLVRGGSSSGWKLQRGAILGALSSAHSTLSYPIVAKELYTGLKIADEEIARNPYTDMNQIHLKHVRTSNLSVRNVMSPQLLPTAARGEGLQKKEAVALFSCLKRERGIFSPANDELFVSKFVESGGNLGLFERGLQRTLL